MMNTRDLLKLLSMKDQLDSFSSSLHDLEYLRKLSCDDLLHNYFPALINDNTTSFSNFTQEHRDSYIRLKFRAINKQKKSQEPKLYQPNLMQPQVNP